MGKNYSPNSRDDDNNIDTYALAVTRMDASWSVTALPAAAEADYVAFERNLRNLRAEGPLFGILNRACEYFALVRPGPGGSQIFVSDIDAALDDDIIIDALEDRGIDTDIDPDDDDWDGLWAVGDFDILADLGLPDSVLSVIVDNDESWADDQIAEIADALGFTDALDRAVN